MADFLTLYHDELVWFAVLAVGLVVGNLTDFGQFTKHRSIRWKVRLIALPVICAIVAFVTDYGPCFRDDLIFTIFLSLLIWYALFFPRWYIWDLFIWCLFKHDNDDKNK